MDSLSKIYQWCCDQWPNQSDWDIIDERINWRTGDLTVTYKFTDNNKRLLFYFVWVDKLKN